MQTERDQALAATIRRAVSEALQERNIFPLYTSTDVASIFRVSVNSVLSWRQRGLLKAHCHVISGCAWRWLFTHRDVIAFFEENFPSEEDARGAFGEGSEFSPKTSRVIQIRKMFAMRKLYSRTHSRRRKADDQ